MGWIDLTFLKKATDVGKIGHVGGRTSNTNGETSPRQQDVT